MSVARRYCFTINNWDNATVDKLVSFALLPQVKYLIFSHEDEGTPHIQGFFILNSPQRMFFFKSRVSNSAHLEATKGSAEQASAYCKKDGDGQFTEFGDCPMTAGERVKTDWEEVLKAAEEDRLDDIPAGIRIRNFSAIEFYRKKGATERAEAEWASALPNHSLTTWQADLDLLLSSPPDNRTIIWVFDPSGNKGKTWYASYYYKRFPLTTFVCRPARSSDLARCLPPNPRVVFVDVPRARSDTMDWGFFEQIKDGCFIDGKYESRVRRFRPPHVVIMSNAECPEGVFSADRIKKINL